MEQTFYLGRPGGKLTARQEGARVIFEVTMPNDSKGLYKAYITGAGGTLLLGTLMPENGFLRLRRTLVIVDLEKKGCWPIVRAEARMAFSFGQREGTAGLDGWNREGNPARLMGDRDLSRAAGELRSVFLCREEKGFALAMPFDPKTTFPMPPIFCFAHIETINQRLCAVFHFNVHGCPIFQNKEKGSGNTDVANQ